MRTGWLLGVVLLAAAGACGPHLAFPDGGPIGGRRGRRGGCGGGGGLDGGGWTGEAGGSSGQSLYTWEDVAVRVVRQPRPPPAACFSG